MGASQSNNPSSYTKSNIEKLIDKYKLENELCKEDFIRILTSCDETFVNYIWTDAVGSDSSCSEVQFNSILDQCRFRTIQHWFSYLLKITDRDSIANAEKLHMLIDWVSFSFDGVYPILKKSFPGLDNDNIDTSEFITWVDRNLPEFGIDLARYVYRTLSGLSKFSYEIKTELLSIANNFESELISPECIILLCASLPMSYKTSEKVEEFIFMNMKRWIMLYSSGIHGISASKLKENSFDYDGHVILLVKCESGLFCLASDVGFKEDWNAYGDVDARLLQLEPVFKKYVSGTRPVDSNKNKSGIIYSHFSAKSGRRGISVGHNPLSNTVMEIDEDLTKISIHGHAEAITAIEVFAVGSRIEEKLAKLRDVRKWEVKEVNKHKNRKLKAEDWSDNPDREILGMGGINVRNADLVGGIDRDLELKS